MEILPEKSMENEGKMTDNSELIATLLLGERSCM